MYFLRRAKPKASERSEWWNITLGMEYFLFTERGAFYIKRYSFARFFIPLLREWIMHLLSYFRRHFCLWLTFSHTQAINQHTSSNRVWWLFSSLTEYQIFQFSVNNFSSLFSLTLEKRSNEFDTSIDQIQVNSGGMEYSEIKTLWPTCFMEWHQS